jgi:hypothetical protein
MSTHTIPPETGTEITRAFTDAERAELGDRLFGSGVAANLVSIDDPAHLRTVLDGFCAALTEYVPVRSAQLGELARRLRNTDCEQCAKGICAVHGKIR